MRNLIDIVTRRPNVRDELGQLKKEAEAMSVFLSVSYNGSDHIHLDEMGRDMSDPSSKGSGAEIMNRLCRIADRHRLGMTLAAEGREPALEKYYRRFGFVHDVDADRPEFEYGSTPMRRLPRIRRGLEPSPPSGGPTANRGW
jgi:hypothetical protein